MANFKCILCIFKIQNTVFVFKYIFPHSILHLYLNNFFHSILYFYLKYILMYLCPSLMVTSIVCVLVTVICNGMFLSKARDCQVQKLNCSWLFVTHQKCQSEDVVRNSALKTFYKYTEIINLD